VSNLRAVRIALSKPVEMVADEHRCRVVNLHLAREVHLARANLVAAGVETIGNIRAVSRLA